MQDRIVWLLAVAGGAILLAVALWQHSGGSGQEIHTGNLSATSGTALALSPPLSEPIQVEVLNGCGTPQLAARLTKKARSLGLDVIDEGNAESFAYLQSMVIDRRGDLQKARRVAAILGIPNCIQQISDNPSRLAEVSIIIGRDYEQLRLLAPESGRQKE